MVGRKLGVRTKIAIPSTVLVRGKTYPVTGISVRAFYRNNLTSVTIPDSVTSIGYEAFRDNNLTSVTIPDSVRYLGERAFYDNKLTSVIIPDSVTNIGYETFRDNKLTSVTIPDSVTSIGSAAFLGNRLTSVTIPDSVRYIGELAFYRNDLTMGIVTLDGLNFKVCMDGTAAVKGRAPGNTDTEIAIPESVSVRGKSFPVTEMGSFAFQCNTLTSVTIPDSVTKIGYYAFRYNNLTSVTIPDSVTSIGDYAFQNNKHTSVHIGNSAIDIGELAFECSQVFSITIGDSLPVEFNELLELVGVTYENVTALGKLQRERRNAVKELVMGRGYDLQDAITALELVYL